MTFVQEIKATIEQHADELQAEVDRLRRAAAELNGGKVAKARPKPQAKPKKRRRRRRKGTRGDEAVKIVDANPEGITAKAIADALKVKPNYMYRVMDDLTNEGRVQKKGRSYYPGGGPT